MKFIDEKKDNVHMCIYVYTILYTHISFFFSQKNQVRAIRISKS